jgi:prepilin-type N-terminal cleavage/methylation domain-containing protein
MDLPEMPLTRPRGFTLVDVLVAMVLFGIIGMAATRTLLSLERTLRGVRERASLDRAFDAALTFVASELSDVGPGDLLVTTHDSLTYRALRATGLACLVRPGEIRLLADRLSGSRRPDPGRDSLLLYAEADTTSAHGLGWIAVPIRSVGSGSCNGRAAVTLGTALDTVGLMLQDSVPQLLPVRTFETMQLRLYRSLGAWWLGARSVSTGEAIQPLAGPFDTTGSGFAFYDSAGGPAALPAAVSGIDLRLSGRALGWNGQASEHVDSAGISLEPRNLHP